MLLSFRLKFPNFDFSFVFRMVGCTPFLVVSYFYLWFVPPFISGRFIWYLGFYCLYQTLITVSVCVCVCLWMRVHFFFFMCRTCLQDECQAGDKKG